MNDAIAAGKIVPDGGDVKEGQTTFRQFAGEVVLPAWQQLRPERAAQS